MGAAYSVNLRRKVVQACERGTSSQAQVARFLGVSLAFVEKLLRLYRRTGALEPDRKRAGRPGLILTASKKGRINFTAARSQKHISYMPTKPIHKILNTRRKNFVKFR